MSPSAKIRISPDEILSLDNVHNLPYLKHIELTKCAPSHFGLEKWTRPFVIPDNWMRKIYRKEVWRDTEVPEPASEPISKSQKKILCEWLFYKSPVRDQQASQYESRRSRNNSLQHDDLLHIPIEIESDEECEATCFPEFVDSEKPKRNKNLKVEDEWPKISVCHGHKIQPEFVIFERAILKMKNLSADEEAQFNTLINDGEFMKLLSDNIGCYLGLKEADH